MWHAFGYFAGILVFSFTAGPRSAARMSRPPVSCRSRSRFILLVALALFRQLQATAFASIQLASTLAQVSDRGREVIEHLYRNDRAAHPATDVPEQPRRVGKSAGRTARRCCR